jgi:hypothetical protein
MFGLFSKKPPVAPPKAPAAPRVVGKNGQPLRGAAEVTARAKAWRKASVARFLKQGHRDNVTCKVPGCGSKSPGDEYMPLCVDHFRALGNLKYHYWTTIVENQASPSPTHAQSAWFLAAMDRLDPSGRWSRDGGAYAFGTMEKPALEAVHACIWCEYCGTWWVNPKTWKHGPLCKPWPMNSDGLIKSRITTWSNGTQSFSTCEGWGRLDDLDLMRAYGWKWLPESKLLEAKEIWDRRLARGW